MSQSSIRTVLAVAATVVCASLPTLAQAQANCDWYGKTALRQQQENEQRKCGQTGPGWSSDLKAHMTWCAANPDLWKSEAQRRDQALATCVKK